MAKKNNNSKNKSGKPESKKTSSAMFSNLRNNLKDKYKLDELKEEIEKVEQDQLIEEVTPVSTSNTCIADNIGWNNWKILLRNFIYGIFMGFSDGIPGYSGGTTLSIIGFYESLITNVKLIFKPDVKRYFWKYLIWFLPFLIAWGGIFLAFSKIVSVVSENGNGIILVFLFGFFALFTIPIFYIKNKSELIDYTHFSKELKSGDKKTILYFVMFICGFIMLLTFALVSHFVPISFARADGGKIIGVTFLGQGKINTSSFDTSRIFLWLAGGFLAGFCMLIPGVSGSLVLYMLNIYPDLSYSLSHIFENANLIPWVITIIIGSFCGIVASTFIINYLLKRFKMAFMNFSFGLVVCSFVSIFVSLSPTDYHTLNNPVNIGCSVAMIFVALIINAVIFIALNETHKIDYPKLRFMQSVIKPKESSVVN